MTSGKHSWPEAYTTSPRRHYIEYDRKDLVDVSISPPSAKGIDALRLLTSTKHKRRVVEGNRLYEDSTGTLYVPTASANALLRRGLVDMWVDENSFVKQTFIAINENGRDWLKLMAPKPKKKLTKRQKDREIEHLLEVLGGRRDDGT